MVLKERTWHFNNAIPNNFCKAIIKHYSSQREEQATVGSKTDGGLIEMQVGILMLILQKKYNLQNIN